jgi:hypothetical protein
MHLICLVCAAHQTLTACSARSKTIKFPLHRQLASLCCCWSCCCCSLLCVWLLCHDAAAQTQTAPAWGRVGVCKLDLSRPSPPPAAAQAEWQTLPLPLPLRRSSAYALCRAWALNIPSISPSSSPSDEHLLFPPAPACCVLHPTSSRQPASDRSDSLSNDGAVVLEAPLCRCDSSFATASSLPCAAAPALVVCTMRPMPQREASTAHGCNRPPHTPQLPQITTHLARLANYSE